MDFNLTLTDAEVNVIGQLLTQAPWAVADPILKKLQQQVNEQTTGRDEEAR